jgi:hypothetical protein
MVASTASHRWQIGVVLVLAAGLAIKAVHAFVSPPPPASASSPKQSSALQKHKGTRGRGRRSREVKAAEQETGAAKKGEYRPRQEYTGLIDTPTTMTMETIAVVRSPYKERFGTPRQANVTAGVLDGKVHTAFNIRNAKTCATEHYLACKQVYNGFSLVTIQLILRRCSKSTTSEMCLYCCHPHVCRRSKGTSCLQKGEILSTH